MKIVNWRVKAVYLLIAAVLAVGGVAGLVATSSVSAKQSVTYSASLVADPVYAGVGQGIQFTFTCDLPGATYSLHGDTGTILSGSVASGSFVMSWNNTGRKHVAVEALGDTDLWGHTDVMISGYMLDPGLAHNVLGQLETFTLPSAFHSLTAGVDYNVTWGPSGSAKPWYSVVSGGGINDNWITVNCDGVGDTLEGVELDVAANIYYGPIDASPDQIYTGTKMWGKIDATVLTPMVYDPDLGWVPATTRSSAVIWDEELKEWEGGIRVNETVLGSYNTNTDSENPTGILEIPADGAVVHWFVVDSTADVSGLASLTNLGAIEAAIAAMPSATLVHLSSDTTISGDLGTEGLTGIGVTAEGEEAVYIIAVAAYPNGADPLLKVHAEIETWNFFTNEVDVVPQVRWVGEKIVLEKYFGMSYNGDLVHFEITEGQGALEDTDLAGPYGWPDSDVADTDSSVWSIVEDGVARVILQGPNPEEVQVLCSLYDWGPSNWNNYSYTNLGDILNEHLFVVYFLKLEDITLGNVEGERVDNPLTNATVEGHDSGIFSPSNPWADPWGSDQEYYETSVVDGGSGGVVGPVDSTTGELNISQDTLLRARVRGWFIGNQDSGRLARQIDSNHNGRIDIHDITLPAGRWVLPDDWQYLASIDLDGYNPYWDIMSAPNSNVMSDADGNPNPELSLDTLGAYVEWGVLPVPPLPSLDMITGLVKEWPVIGPYSSLDNYSPDGFWRGTIVPDGQLNWWDCPMPAAKITLQIGNGLGYFKEVAKGDVYYNLVNLSNDLPGPDGIAYTNPFYAIMNPANPFLSDMAFVNNGGYDWNSWNPSYGPYDLWHFVNQQGSDINHPTMVQVYSDNHGEAMVWLNGDNGLNLDGQASYRDEKTDKGSQWTTAPWDTGLGYTIDTNGWKHWTQIASSGETVRVGNTTAVASADYPYFRADPMVYSNTVTKDWTWGETKLVDVQQLTALNGMVYPYDQGHKLVVVWVTDRDGMPAVGVPITWSLGVGSAKLLDSSTGGFYSWTGVNLSADQQSATSVTWLPDNATIDQLWNTTKLGPCNCAMAAIEVAVGASPTQVDLYVGIGFAEGVDLHISTLDSTVQDMMDPLLTAGLNSGVYEGKAQSVVAATQTIGPQGSNTLVAIWWQDNQGVWHAYQPGAPDWSNDLSMLEPGNTYWVRVSANCFWNWALN